MPFQAAPGHDNTAGLSTVTPQPRSPGITYAEVRHSANGAVARHGNAATEWRYGYMTPAWFAALQALLGISETVKSAEVTIQTVQNDFQTFEDYNAIAVHPEAEADYKYDGGAYLDVVWRFKELRAVT